MSVSSRAITLVLSGSEEETILIMQIGGMILSTTIQYTGRGRLLFKRHSQLDGISLNDIHRFHQALMSGGNHASCFAHHCKLSKLLNFPINLLTSIHIKNRPIISYILISVA